MHVVLEPLDEIRRIRDLCRRDEVLFDGAGGLRISHITETTHGEAVEDIDGAGLRDEPNASQGTPALSLVPLALAPPNGCWPTTRACGFIVDVEITCSVS